LYEIVRLFSDDKKESEIIKSNVTLEEAQKHCKNSSTRKEGEWFDSYREM